MSNLANMNEKEHWIERHLNTGEFIHRTEPGSDLMNRLRAIPGNVPKVVNMVPKRVIWMVAAGLALLISLNLLSVKSYEKASDRQEISQTDDIYFSYLKQL